MIAAIILARGGSKGIPKKNLVTVSGKPLIAWSIEAARHAELVDGVYVSTDCLEIAAVAERYGATVINRPAELATDEATSEAALVHALERLHSPPSLVVFLQPTSPLRHPRDIDCAVLKLQREHADSLFSARKLEGYVWVQDGDGVVPTYRTRQRRQDWGAERLEENGSIYVFRPEVLMCYGKRLGGKVAAYEQHPLCGFQIDEPQDIPLLEGLMA